MPRRMRPDSVNTQKFDFDNEKSRLAGYAHSGWVEEHSDDDKNGDCKAKEYSSSKLSSNGVHLDPGATTATSSLFGISSVRCKKSNQKFYLISESQIAGLSLFVFLLFAVILTWYKTEISVDPPNEMKCSNDGHSCVASQQSFKNGVVASDQSKCSEIGKKIISDKGGNIIDSGIATLLCLSVLNMHSAGLGGGGFYVYHNHLEKKTYVINSREQAPAKSHRDMYFDDPKSVEIGAMSIAIPGEIAGLWKMHEKFGHLPWKELFTPTIKLCREGFPIGYGLNLALQFSKKTIHKMKSLEEILLNPATGDFYKTGEILKLPKLARTLERIAEGGIHDFYNGSLAKDIVDDIADAKGIITKEDLANFKVKVEPAHSIKLNDGNNMHVNPPPSSGALMALIYNIMNGYKWRTDTLSCKEASVLFHHRLTEAWKFAFSIRHRMGDQDFVDMKDLLKNVSSSEFAELLRSKIDDDKTFPPDYYGPLVEPYENDGTTHLSIMDQHGNAFAATESINFYFGSKVVGKRTGIIFGNSMDDFSIPNRTNAFNLPPSQMNFIEPGKRPMSTMCPTIVTDKDGDVIMVAGASGGSKILTATSYVILRSLLLKDDLKNAIDARRIHHQFIPDRIDYEPELDKFLFEGLQAKGHEMYLQLGSERGAVVQAIAREFMQAYCDARKGGCPHGIN